MLRHGVLQGAHDTKPCTSEVSSSAVPKFSSNGAPHDMRHVWLRSLCSTTASRRHYTREHSRARELRNLGTYAVWRACAAAPWQPGTATLSQADCHAIWYVPTCMHLVYWVLNHLDVAQCVNSTLLGPLMLRSRCHAVRVFSRWYHTSAAVGGDQVAAAGTPWSQ